MNLEFGVIPSVEVIAGKCNVMKSLAIAEKVKVGCVIEGWKPNSSKRQWFGGSNIELSKSYVIHAEYMALLDCLHHGYYPVNIYCTSQSEKEDVFLCGDCRQKLSEVNREMGVLIFNPNGSIKGEMRLSELLPKSKDTKKKNNKFLEITREKGRFDIYAEIGMLNSEQPKSKSDKQNDEEVSSQ